jgi:hypothetical protein
MDLVDLGTVEWGIMYAELPSENNSQWRRLRK